MARPFWFRSKGGDVDVHAPSPVGSKIVVVVSRVNGKTGKVEEVARGTFDVLGGRWSFTGKEVGTNTWLEKTFNNPPVVKQKQYLRDDEGFLVYLMQIIMPRKGLSMDWDRNGDI
jgi:hypothetical protein